MKANSYFNLFEPKNHSFFPLFENNARNLVNASLLLEELMSSDKAVEYERIYLKIQDIEHIGDEITRKTYELLNKSFITPFDRKDIHELTAHIEEAVDSINGISRRFCNYKLRRILPVYREMAQLIFEAAEEIEKAVHCLKSPSSCKKIIQEAFNKVKIIENKADDLYFNGIAELFEKEDNTIELLKNSKILEILESCVDEEEDVTDTLKTILIKTL
jgi:uncharacterized protein Yka (UPF0111/DUF47 family)